MLWNQRLPKAYYDYVKKPEIFEYLLNQNVSFRGVNAIVRQFVSEPNNWLSLKNCFVAYYSTYQYIYSMLFPKYYSKNNKYGLKNKIKFAISYKRWRESQKQEQLAKNPFNFNVPVGAADKFEVVQRHEYEQKPISIDDDIEFKADVADTKVVKMAAADATGGGSNKDSIMPYPPESPVTYKYAPTMCLIRELDRKYFLPKVAKNIKKNRRKKASIRSQQKKQLLEKLKVNTEKMEKLKNVNK